MMNFGDTSLSHQSHIITPTTSDHRIQPQQSCSVVSTNLSVPFTPLCEPTPPWVQFTPELSSQQNVPRLSHIPTIIPTCIFLDGDTPIPILQNIVSTVNLDVNLNLREIASKALNAEYNPIRFSAVIMRIKDPKTTALIFNNGKIVCTGAKSIETSILAARKFARIIQKLGFNAMFGEFKVQNMVASCDVKFRIQLESLAISHSHFSTYEPELFPGLIYRMIKPSVVFLVFASGKIVITGTKEKSFIDDGFSKIYPILKAFKR